MNNEHRVFNFVMMSHCARDVLRMRAITINSPDVLAG